MKRPRKRGMAAMLAGIMVLTMMPGSLYQTEAAEAQGKEPIVLTTEKDVYVQGGGDADKVMGGDAMLVKTPEEASLGTTYHRKGLVEFDLSDISGEYNTALLKLEVRSYGKQYTDTDCLGIYTTDAGWDVEMTWNTMPGIREQAASAYKSDVDENGIMLIDISDAVEQALDAGEDAISLELSFAVPQGGDHAISFYRHTAEGKTGPVLELSYDEEKEQNAAIFKELREKWQHYIIGDELDLSDQTILDYVKSLDEEANQYWNEMNKSDEADRKQLWDEYPIIVYNNTSQEARIGSVNVSYNFEALRTLALAYKTEGCQLYQREEVMSEIRSALDFMVGTYYNGTTSTDWGDWFVWEIRTPQALTSILLILQDELTEQEISYYLTGVERYAGNCNSAGIPGSPTMTGANLLDKAMVVAQTGVLTDNEKKLEHMREAQKEVYRYVESDDGFYEDGSYIQHHSLAYIAGYGIPAYENIGVFFYMLKDTPWEIRYDDGCEQMIYDTIFNSIEPLIYDMQIADSTAGRTIVNSASDARTRAVGIMETILPIGASMDGEMKDRFNSFAKDFIQTDEEYYFDRASNITTIQMAKELLEDESVAPRSNYSIHKTYAGMDRISHVRPGYMLNIAMSSTRQSKFENYNGQGLKLWNIADGMTYLYTDDLDQYSSGYWATIDPFRLAGTTAERALTRKDFTSYAESGKTPYSWAGGVTLGDYGTAGVQMKSLGNESGGNGSALTGADSKKSWFMFDDEIAAIGSSITSTTGNCVETIIDNRQIALDLSNEVTINGETPDITDNSDNNDKHGTEITDARWAHIQGNTEGSSIGYYFPEENTTIHALKERRDSNYSSQNAQEDIEVSGSYATLWFDHGTNPSGASYEYVILPGKTADETAAYAEDSPIQVLANNDNVHAVRHKDLDMVGVNFWNDTETTAAGITSNKKASVMMQKMDDGTLELAVSDPTQQNNGTIELTVNLPCKAVISKDETVTVEQLSPVLKLSVNTAGSMGESHVVKLEMSEEAAENAVIGVGTSDTVKAEKGTEFGELDLPETVEIETRQYEKYDVEVDWSSVGYDKDRTGIYELEGEITLPDGVTNPAGLKAEITVQVGNPFIAAVQDTYVRDNSETGDQHKREGELIVKNDHTGYSRKAVMKFPLDEISADMEHVTLLFEFTGMPEETFRDLDVYRIDADWDESEITWENYPERIGEPIANVTLEDIGRSLVQEIDVTELVKQAIADGESEISFEFSISDYSKNNLARIHSTESTAGQAPALFWEETKQGESGQADKTDLSIQIAKAEERLEQTDDYPAGQLAELQELLEAGKAVYENETASQEDVDAASEAIASYMESMTAVRKFTITASAGEGGSISPNGNVTVREGESQTFAIVPQEGYEIANVTVNGESHGAITNYTFESVEADGEIVAEFKAIEPSEEVSKSTLEYFLNSAKTHLENGDVDTCVESVQKLFEEAVAEGEAVMADDNATRDEVMNVTMKLIKAIHALDMKAADKTDLEMAVELGEMIDLSKYVEAGQKEFTDALAAAREILSDSDAMQGDVNEAWDALVTAMENLRLKANKDALEDLLNEAAGLDLNRYTEESAAAFRTALASAQAVFADETLSEDDQKKVDDAVTALKAAKAGLTAADGSQEGKDPEDGDRESNPSGMGNADQNNGNSNSGDSVSKAARTGDPAPITGLMMLVLVSGAAVLAVSRRRSK